jgi:DNA-binding winged helix-turn-helix (wHTH) protein
MRVTFDQFVFDTDCRQLERAGEPLHLQPKAFQLLQYLIEAAPAAISHAHLYDLLWGETHVVEANLRNLVADIRAVLGDGRRDARYIRTVHGFGYRFVAEPKIEAHPYRSSYLLEGPLGRYALNQGPNLVGCDPGAEVHLEGPGVARVHAAIIVCGDEIMIETQSGNHETCVGSQPVDAPVPLRVGDVLRFGTVSLTLRMRVPAARREEDQRQLVRPSGAISSS